MQHICTNTLSWHAAIVCTIVTHLDPLRLLVSNMAAAPDLQGSSNTGQVGGSSLPAYTSSICLSLRSTHSSCELNSKHGKQDIGHDTTNKRHTEDAQQQRQHTCAYLNSTLATCIERCVPL
jgi:hypothetical protein